MDPVGCSSRKGDGLLLEGRFLEVEDKKSPEEVGKEMQKEHNQKKSSCMGVVHQVIVESETSVGNVIPEQAET